MEKEEKLGIEEEKGISIEPEREENLRLFLRKIILDIFDGYISLKESKASNEMINNEDEENKSSGEDMNMRCVWMESGGEILKNNIRPRIEHPKVYDQHMSSACGFYALWNAIRLIDALSNISAGQKSIQYANYQLKRMRNGFAFHKFYHKTRHFVIHNCPNISAKGITELLKEGSLERYQCKFLLDSPQYKPIYKIKQQMKKIPGHHIYFGFIFFGFLNFQSNIYEINELDLTIGEFMNNDAKDKGKRYLVLFWGITNHWTTLIITRETMNLVNPKYEFIYMDSVNLEFLHLNPSEYKLKLSRWEMERRSKGKTPLNQFKLHMKLQSLKDVFQLLWIMERRILEGESLISYYLQAEIRIFLNSYSSIFQYIYSKYKEQVDWTDIDLLEDKEENPEITKIWGEKDKKQPAWMGETQCLFSPSNYAHLEKFEIIISTFTQSQINDLILPHNSYLLQYQPIFWRNDFIQLLVSSGVQWVLHEDSQKLIKWMNIVNQLIIRMLKAEIFSSKLEEDEERAEIKSKLEQFQEVIIDISIYFGGLNIY